MTKTTTTDTRDLASIGIDIGKDVFHIVGFDQTIFVGPRVTLRYFHNAELLALMKQRMGWPR